MDYEALCNDIINLDPQVRFAAIMNSQGEKVAGEFREGVSSLLNPDEVKMSMHYALQSGMSSPDAMKIFQKKAAISRAQLIEHNKNTQIQYGIADKSVQDQFDKSGKLPRTDD